jgi:hypothetical protein
MGTGWGRGDRRGHVAHGRLGAAGRGGTHEDHAPHGGSGEGGGVVGAQPWPVAVIGQLRHRHARVNRCRRRLEFGAWGLEFSGLGLGFRV